MTDAAAVDEALASAGIAAGRRDARDLSGGCIHRVSAVTLDDGRVVVAKIDDAARHGLFDEEARSLRALAATGTVTVPRPLVVGTFGDRAVLLMSAVPPAPATEAGWRALGRALAALHAHDAGSRYGFEIDNHLGTTLQPNGWDDDWVTFNAARRLGWQLDMAGRAGRLEPEEIRRLERLIDGLDGLIPRRPRPALLHGDLWSGNAVPTRGDDGAPDVAVIDPACSVGDGWADVAMMTLFGGFPDACLDAYADAVDDHEGVPERVAVYQLYHLLNHVNIFGRGYAGQALAVVGRLGF